MNENANTFFKNLINTPGPAGFEESVQEVVRNYAKDFSDSVQTDVHGNVIAAKNPDTPYRIMLAGHADQIGFIVNYIDSDGYIYFLPLGGWDPQIVVGSRVVIWAKNGPVSGVIGKKPIHLLQDDERTKVTKIQDMWIDIGASSKEAAEKAIAVGDCITVELACRELLENKIAATGTDDKAGVFVIMEALRRIDPNKLKVAVFAVSTVQEEVGMRGSKTSAFGIDPQVGIAVDVTFSTDCPTIDKKTNGDILLGAGPVVACGPNLNRKLTAKLLDIAKANEIKVQLGVENRITGTDAASLQISRAGMATGLISIPNRYMHTPVELVSCDDLDAAAELLARYCESVEPDESYIPAP